MPVRPIWLVAGAIQVNVKLPEVLPVTEYVEYPVAIRVGDEFSAYVYVPVRQR